MTEQRRFAILYLCYGLMSWSGSIVSCESILMSDLRAGANSRADVAITWNGIRLPCLFILLLCWSLRNLFHWARLMYPTAALCSSNEFIMSCGMHKPTAGSLLGRHVAWATWRLASGPCKFASSGHLAAVPILYPCFACTEMCFLSANMSAHCTMYCLCLRFALSSI